MCLIKNWQNMSSNNLGELLDNEGHKDLVEGEGTLTFVLGNIVKRGLRGIVYTSLGPSNLLYLNPCKPLKIYSNDVKMYFKSHRNIPHIYSLLEKTIASKTDTTLLTSGDRGSGKSFNINQCLDYLSVNNHGKKLYDFNTCINLFGCTLSNRTCCIKSINVEFDFGGNILGGGLKGYYLEKTRVLNRDNFGVFFALIWGAESAVLKSLGLLRNPSYYKILGNTNFSHERFANAESCYSFLKETLNSVKIDYSQVFQILALILKLGNISFVQSTNFDGSEGIEICHFGRGECEGLETILQTNNLPFPNSASKSNEMLSNLITTIYSRLFSWLLCCFDAKTKHHFRICFLDYPGKSLSNEEDFSKLISDSVQKKLVDIPLRSFQETCVKEGLNWILIETGRKTHETAKAEETMENLDYLKLLPSLSKSKISLLSKLFPPSQKPPLSQLTQLKINIKNCLDSLPQKTAHCRCITTKTEIPMDTNYIKHQLNNSIDYLKVVKSLAVQFFTFSQFLKRYKLLSLKTWPSYSDERIGCYDVMTDLCFVDGRDYFLGRERIFIFRFEVIDVIEEWREERLEDLAVAIAAWWRGVKGRRDFAKKKYSVRLIERWWEGILIGRVREGKMLFKLQRRSVLVIQGAYIQWKRLLYLHQLSTDISKLYSPVSKYWPVVPSYLIETNGLLKILFHRWRCRLYRSNLTAIDRLRLNEKSTASSIFRNKKQSYPRSVSHPFLGDYIRLKQNSQWRRNTMDTDNFIVFADLINKVARQSGKFLPIVIAITTTNILLLDPRTLTMKYRIPFKSLKKISMSCYNDDICVFHIVHHDSDPIVGNNCLCGNNLKDKYDLLASSDTGGDIVLHTCHLVEMVTKIVMVGGVNVAFGNCFPATFNEQSMEIKFEKTINTGDEIIPPINMKIKRKLGIMEFSF